MRYSTKRLMMAACATAVAAMHCAPPEVSGGDLMSPGSDGTMKSGTGTGGSSGDGTATPTRTGLPCDVDALLRTRCQTCHGESPSAGASSKLVSWEDLHAPYKDAKILDAVKARVHAETRPMPPNPRLTPPELAVLDAWIDAGAPKSDATCTNDGPRGPQPLACDGIKTALKPSTPFVMGANAPLDQYVCFGVDVDRAQKHHLVAGAPIVDNKNILHHILVFQSDKAVDPTPKACDATASAAWVMVGGWAPGGSNLELPPEAGFPEEPGKTHYVVQLHYNNAQNRTGDTDSSGFELCATDKLRANDAGIVAFGSMRFDIPPRATHSIVCSYPWLHGDVTFTSAQPHMHKHGASLLTERVPNAGLGKAEVIAEQKVFDFESQVGFKVSGKAKRGDVIRTRCAWKNASDAVVKWGEGTDDEMCFNFLTYYPKVASLFSWAQPSAVASCKVE